jgi:protein-L-isoaspartate(D-aspartate) O-methyltransferase
MGQSRHFGYRPTASGLPPEADIIEAGRHVSMRHQPKSKVHSKLCEGRLALARRMLVILNAKGPRSLAAGTSRVRNLEAGMNDPVEVQRRYYAEELWFRTRMSSPLKAAFANVPRERFVGMGPWRIKSPWSLAEYWTTEDGDPRNVYHDVLIALDESLGLNNGMPSLWAFSFDKLGVAANDHVLHLGCGTGYYTAILAELVGLQGGVEAIEIEAVIAERARTALAPWPQVVVVNGNGANGPFAPADVIVASAGATHPLPAWLDALKLGGRLLFPMTVTRGPGGMLLITRLDGDEFAARFICRASFYEFSGARDADVSRRLEQAIASDQGVGVKSLRRDHHSIEETCWLHDDYWCLSCRENASTPAKDQEIK